MTVTILKPAAGEQVKGVYRVVAEATGRSTDFYIDGVKKGRDRKAPFSFDWYTTNYPDGPHTLKVMSGGESASVEVTVANGVTPPPPPTSGGGYPASFYTGPLGTSNLLPPLGKGFLASMFGGGGIYPDAAWKQISERQAAIGAKYAIIQGHYGGDTYWDGVYGAPPPTWYEQTTWEQRTFDNGSFCAMCWTPDYSIGDVLAGKADAIHAKMGAYWATFKPRIIINRLFHEFDGGFKFGVDGPGGPYSPDQFKAAYRRQVTNIRNAGGTNVGFWWCPNEGGTSHGRSWLSECYPGDEWVDWTGADWYNYNDYQSSVLRPAPNYWAEWWELFNYGVATTLGWSNYDMFGSGKAVSGTRGWTGIPRVKPFVIGETSTLYDAKGDASRKANWFKNIVSGPNGIKTLPNMVGISFYDADVHTPDNYNWKVDSNAYVVNTTGQPDPVTLNGFVTMARDDYFRVA